MASAKRAHATVDLRAIAENVATLQRRSPHSEVMAIVKAGGYGHGMVPAARAAIEGGATRLGVAYPSEARELLQANLGVPIFTWLYGPGEDLRDLVEAGVEISVSDLSALDQVSAAAQNCGTPAHLHVKVDTGLGRGGSASSQWGTLLKQVHVLLRRGTLDLKGIWSHLACSEDPQSPATEEQLRRFHRALDAVADEGLEPEFRHLANTGGIVNWPQTHFDLVRAGIGIYGLTPGMASGGSEALGLRPAMRAMATVALVKDVPAGQGVSYGLTYTTARPSRLALIPLGYADGVPRSASNRLPIVINGQVFRASGVIAMDQFVVDVGDAAVERGDDVVLFGGDSRDLVCVDDWAQAANTINYEIVTRLGPRLERRYTEM